MRGLRLDTPPASVAAEAAGAGSPYRGPLPAEIADHAPPPSDRGLTGEEAPSECPRVLVVEPCKAHANALVLVLQRAGFTVAHAASAEEAVAHALRCTTFHLILSELKLPGQSGLGLLRRVRQACPATAFFMLTGQPDVASSVSALALGADEYLTKPLDETRLVALCVAAVARTPRQVRSALRVPDPAAEPTPRAESAELQAQSPAMRELLVRVRGLSQSAAPVLLRGEPGAGKRLVGQLLHRLSARAAGPLLIVRPEELSRDLLRLELWGRADSAAPEQPGAVVRASGGSLLITEVERLSATDRWLLARLITRGLYRPVGAVAERAVAVRVLLTTAQPASLAAGDFEEELLPGLRCVELRVPPLRERGEDLVPLALQLLDEIAARRGEPALGLPAQSARLLLAYGWPGNGSELRAVLQRAAQRATGPQLTPELLPSELTLPLTTAPGDDRTPAPFRGRRRALRREGLRLATAAGGARGSWPSLTLARALRERRRQHHREEAPRDGL